MGVILLEELDKLVNEYKNATTRTDRLIKRRLEAIVNCYEECTLEEREFADDITIEFCRLISIIKEQHQKELSDIGVRSNFVSDNSTLCYTPLNAYNQSDKQNIESSQICAKELLDEFYDHFNGRIGKTTLKDYVARINTFAYSDKYLAQMIRNGDLGVREITIDPVIFTYINIELIIARFNTKDENGNSVKQKLNIRSALKKFNEFKLTYQAKG